MLRVVSWKVGTYKEGCRSDTYFSHSELYRMKEKKMRIFHVRRVQSRLGSPEKRAEGGVCKNERQDMICRLAAPGDMTSGSLKRDTGERRGLASDRDENEP